MHIKYFTQPRPFSWPSLSGRFCVCEFASLLKSANPHQHLWHVLGQGGRNQLLNRHTRSPLGLVKEMLCSLVSVPTMSKCPFRCFFPATLLAFQRFFLMLLFKMVTTGSTTQCPQELEARDGLCREKHVWDELQCCQLSEFNGDVLMVYINRNTLNETSLCIDYYMKTWAEACRKQTPCFL